MRYVRKPAPTTREISVLPPGRVYYGEGLVLIVTPTSRRWAFRYTSPITHRVTETSVGPWPEINYTFARHEVALMQVQVAKGEDPVLAKRQQRSAGTTFAQACEEWIKQHRFKWRSLRHHNALIGKHGKPLAEMPIRMITTPMIVDALRDLWKVHPEQAHRAVRMWARVFDYAKSMGYRTGDNPALWRGNIENIFHLPKNHDKHYPSLPFKELPEFMTRLRFREVKGHSATMLEFQILTASRPGETRGMRWSEVDLINRIWTIPPERTKQNREHRVPLSERCMEILALQNEYRTGDFVFTGYNRVALDQKSTGNLLRSMGVRVVPHGFRRSFRNWCFHMRIDRDLAELSLGHGAAKNKTEAAYLTEDGLEERRPLMDAWAEYCGSVHTPY
jgi:integrase